MISENASVDMIQIFATERSVQLPLRKFKSSMEIDKSKGRAFLKNGRIFYSPNCSREVDIPQPLPTGTNPFYPPSNGPRRLWDLDPSGFRQPAWWSIEFAWLAFLELSDDQLNFALFSDLQYRGARHAIEDEDGYALSASEKNAWLRLDRQLTTASLLLSTHNHLYTMCPYEPWQFGYLRTHSTYGILRVCLSKSLKWFSISLARLSYLIAGAETREAQFDGSASLARLHWVDLLLTRGATFGIDCTWIDMLCDTTVTEFSSLVDRAGIFLDPLSNNELQPSVSWYCHHNVPVWYPWGEKEAHSTDITMLAPLPEQLQLATTFLSKEPSLSDGHDAEDPAQHVKMTSSERLEDTKRRIEEFFKNREKRNKVALTSETTAQRQKRLQREQAPPQTSASMFIWDIDAEGGFQHNEVPRKERNGMFGLYGPNQMRYDSFRNEWNICELWDDFPDDGDSEGGNICEADDRQLEEIPIPVPEDRGHILESDVSLHGRLSGNISSLPDRFEVEVLEVLYLYFGYTSMNPLPTPLPIRDESLRKNVCRSLGIAWHSVQDIQSVFERPAVVAGLDFLIRMAHESHDLTDEWDLNENNRRYVVLTSRFKSFRHVLSTDGVPLYMLDLKDERSADWYLALKKASDVPVVCRLGPEKDEHAIVEFLLENGIPFHTLAPRDALQRNPSTLSRIPAVPIRPANHIFDSNDYYVSYRTRCRFMLMHPRGRAALMHGQLPWRLAVSVVPWERAHGGPSGWYADDKEMIVVKDLETGVELVDDRLTEAEDLALCGTYKCLTDAGVENQVAICSWYMPSHMWTGSNHDHRRWTEYAEKVFYLLDFPYNDSTPGSESYDQPLERQPLN